MGTFVHLAVSADGNTFLDGLSVDNANGIVDQPQLPRFKAWTNYDNYVGTGTWTKIALNNTDYNDQGAFDAGTNRFTAPVDGTWRCRQAGCYKTVLKCPGRGAFEDERFALLENRVPQTGQRYIGWPILHWCKTAFAVRPGKSVPNWPSRGPARA